MKQLFTFIGFIGIINICLGQTNKPLHLHKTSYSFSLLHLINPSAQIIPNQPVADLARSRMYGNNIQQLDSIMVFSLPDKLLQELSVIQYDEQTAIMTQYVIHDHYNRVPVFKNVILFNPDETFHKEYKFRWNDTNQRWDTTNIHQYHYNESGLYLMTISSISANRHYYSKIEYTYNESNMLVAETHYQQSTDETWRPVNKTLYNYSDKQLIEDNILYMNQLNEDWLLLSKRSYTYDTYGNISEVLYWTEEDYPSDEFYIDSKFIYVYDLSVSSDNILFPLGFTSNNKLTEIIAANYDSEHNEWIPQASLVLHYSPGITTSTTEPNTEPAFRVYPNPFDEHINIVSDEYLNLTLNIYDQLGISVLQTHITGSQKVSTVGLPPGIYHCTLDDNKQTIIKRLIKK